MKNLQALQEQLATTYTKLGTCYSKILAYREIIAAEEERVLVLQDEIKSLSSSYSELLDEIENKK